MAGRAVVGGAFLVPGPASVGVGGAVGGALGPPAVGEGLTMIIRAVFAFAALLVLAPSPASAWHRHAGRYRGPVSYAYVQHHHGGDVAIGVLGGIIGGIVIDRILHPPPAVVYERRPFYPPPPDPYDAGYREGYDNGFRRGQTQRYREGRQRGYYEGIDAGRRGY